MTNTSSSTNVSINEEERSLIIAAQNGDMDAFGTLYARYKDRGIRHAKRFGKKEEYRNIENYAEDACQEAFIKVMKGIHTFDPSLPFAPWLYTIIERVIIDMNNKKHPEQLTEKQEERLNNRVADNHIEKPLGGISAKELLDGVIDELPGEQRQLITMYFYSELKEREIAEIQGVSVNTVKSRKKYAQKFLRTRVEARMKELKIEWSDINWENYNAGISSFLPQLF